jgi:hypothetical protein
MRSGGLALALAFGSVVVPPGVVAAQDCPPPPPDLYPADGAPNVPINGVVRVVFHEPYDPELPLDQVLRLYDGADQPVPGSVTLEHDGVDTFVALTAALPLDGSTQYRAVVVLPEFGGEREFWFSTGSGVVDASEPIFGGASSIRVVPAKDVSCSESTAPVPPQEADIEATGRGYRVTVTFPQAQDEAGAANIDYLLVQTSGPTLDEPWLRKRVRTFGSDSLFGAVFLPHAAVAREEICFEVHAEDMFGNRIEPTREACGDPIGPGYFKSMCSVVAAGAPGAGVMGVAFGLATLSVARRRSRRRSSRRPGP